ncbi:TSUP family transporter [bacterium]|nr:TSUP family transporter [bacterium]
MPLDILLTVVGTSIIQSVFGVGVLLFGTPILLALGYEFIKAITILLPISLTINLFQIVKDYKQIDTDFYKKMVIYTIPFVVLFLAIVSTSKIDISMIIGIFLLLVAIKDYSILLKKVIESLLKHEKLFLITMGIIHGATNLGGSLLTAIIHNKKYEKNVIRATVAASYATFAAFQIVTILFSASRNINFVENSLYLFVGVMVYILIETTVYREINSQRYSKYFAIFLFSTGVLLCFKSI